MGLPYRLITAIALGGGYLVSSGRIPQMPQPRLVVAFTVLWVLQSWLWAVWAVILYPKVFSPLRNLPGPGGNGWLMGQHAAISRLPTGVPMLRW